MNPDIARTRLSAADLAKSAGVSGADLSRFVRRLASLSNYGRKLLGHIAEAAYHGRGQQRKPNIAYLPELYESTGLGVEAMYPLLEELRNAGFIEIEDQYPFEDVRIPSEEGRNPLAGLAKACVTGNTPIQDALRELAGHED